MISIIVAIAKNGVIGNKGNIPWELPDDLKHFAKITKRHTVIMGRKTYESIVKRLGHALLGRKNIVITSQSDFKAPFCEIVHSVDEIQREYAEIADEEVFVIGGGEIYKKFLPFTKKLYITDVLTRCEGDTYFPKFDENDWKVVSRETHILPEEKNSHSFTFLEFVRK